jgi:hypothetical protein
MGAMSFFRAKRIAKEIGHICPPRRSTKASHRISAALTTSNEISMLASEKHFNPRQNLKCSTGGAGRKNQSTARPVFYFYERNLG